MESIIKQRPNLSYPEVSVFTDDQVTKEVIIGLSDIQSVSLKETTEVIVTS
jgi:hypothetical protein